MKKIAFNEAKQELWDQVKSFNYKLRSLDSSVVYAELAGPHGQVSTGSRPRIYYILEGQGQFMAGVETVDVQKGDVIAIPPQTTYDYLPVSGQTLKVILFMELWEN